MSEHDVELYRERGLLPPPMRMRGRSGDLGYRQKHVERLRFIARALLYGFSLDAIGQMVEPSGLQTCGDVYRIAERELRRLGDLLGPDAAAVSTLKRLIDSCNKTGGRDGCTIYRTLADG